MGGGYIGFPNKDSLNIQYLDCQKAQGKAFAFCTHGRIQKGLSTVKMS